MHTFEYERFKRKFLQNHFSEKGQCLNRDWTRGAYFKTKGEEKVLMIKHMATEMMFGDFYTAERTNFFGAILSLETDSVFMVTCFFCELLRYHK